MTYTVPVMKQEGTVHLASRCFEILLHALGTRCPEKLHGKLADDAPESRATLLLDLSSYKALL